MSRRTLRGALPTTDSVLAAARERRSSSSPDRPDTIVQSVPGVFRPPVDDPLADGAAGPGEMTSVDTDAILLRGAEAARARRIDLVGVDDRSGLAAVGPWAEQLDDAREAARRSGFQQGRQEGLAAGLEASREQVRHDHDALRQSVDTMFDELRARCDEMSDLLADQVTAMALEIARAVLDRELAVTEDPGAEAIARCLALVPDRGCLTVRLNPDDAETLGEVAGLGNRELVVTPDPSLSSGDAVVTVDHVTVDARLSESLRRVEEALR